MREILFRGKRVDNGEWVEGYCCPCCFGYFPYNSAIVSKDEIEQGCWRPEKIRPETVGQYTGLTDKNGTKVFEGDVIWGDDCTGTWHKGVVEYDDSIGSFIINAKRFMQYPKNENHYDLLGCWSIEGNIHDNPELLKGGAE